LKSQRNICKLKKPGLFIPRASPAILKIFEEFKEFCRQEAKPNHPTMVNSLTIQHTTLLNNFQ